MGYRPPVKRYRLQFEGADYDGLEVVMGGLSAGEYLDLSEALTSPAPEQAVTAFKLTASKVVRWNIQDDDGAIMPLEAEAYKSLRSLEFDFVMLIIGKWMEAVAAVPPPLPGNSNGTGTIPPGLIPMETLSPSPAS